MVTPNLCRNLPAWRSQRRLRCGRVRISCPCPCTGPRSRSAGQHVGMLRGLCSASLASLLRVLPGSAQPIVTSGQSTISNESPPDSYHISMTFASLAWAGACPDAAAQHKHSLVARPPLMTAAPSHLVPHRLQVRHSLRDNDTHHFPVFPSREASVSVRKDVPAVAAY
ncbi:hypothetical protein C8Q72DRAFT_47757 [Fomitopsis betulina]|nr:hypothetical protein C8Q72DRAFT_47757 [Fomitopsis betulina]